MYYTSCTHTYLYGYKEVYAHTRCLRARNKREMKLESRKNHLKLMNCTESQCKNIMMYIIRPRRLSCAYAYYFLAFGDQHNVSHLRSTQGYGFRQAQIKQDCKSREEKAYILPVEKGCGFVVGKVTILKSCPKRVVLIKESTARVKRC